MSDNNFELDRGELLTTYSALAFYRDSINKFIDSEPIGSKPRTDSIEELKTCNSALRKIKKHFNANGENINQTCGLR